MTHVTKAKTLADLTTERFSAYGDAIRAKPWCAA